MPVITLGGGKGGVGKSTVSANLAIALTKKGYKVRLIDTDPQKTLINFCNYRKGTIEDSTDKVVQSRNLVPLSCVACYGGSLLDEIEHSQEHFDFVIIDTRGTDSEELNDAMSMSHLVLIPLRASQADVETLYYMAPLIKRISRKLNPDLQAFVLPYALSTDVKGDKATLKEFLDDQELAGIHLFSSHICYRKPFQKAHSDGLSPLEYKPKDGPSCVELEAVTMELLEYVTEKA